MGIATNGFAWHDTGMLLIHGPNYLLSGYVTPNIASRQTGEFFRFAAAHGMVGVNFRSYTFSWPRTARWLICTIACYGARTWRLRRSGKSTSRHLGPRRRTSSSISTIGKTTRARGQPSARSMKIQRGARTLEANSRALSGLSAARL